MLKMHYLSLKCMRNAGWWRSIIKHGSDGTDVENLRMQSRENTERMAVLQAFVAVRIMQLKMAPEQDATRCCEEVLSVKSWETVMKLKQEKKPLPEYYHPCYGRIEHWLRWEDGKTLKEQEKYR